VLYGQMIAWAIFGIVLLLTFLFRDFILMVILSFIGSTMVVYNLGYITGVLDNIFEVLDRIAYDKNYEVVDSLVHYVQDAFHPDPCRDSWLGHLPSAGKD
jgi:hypothetical protein